MNAWLLMESVAARECQSIAADMEAPLERVGVPMGRRTAGGQWVRSAKAFSTNFCFLKIEFPYREDGATLVTCADSPPSLDSVANNGVHPLDAADEDRRRQCPARRRHARHRRCDPATGTAHPRP